MWRFEPLFLNRHHPYANAQHGLNPCRSTQRAEQEAGRHPGFILRGSPLLNSLWGFTSTYEIQTSDLLSTVDFKQRYRIHEGGSVELALRDPMVLPPKAADVCGCSVRC